MKYNRKYNKIELTAKDIDKILMFKGYAVINDCLILREDIFYIKDDYINYLINQNYSSDTYFQFSFKSNQQLSLSEDAQKEVLRYLKFNIGTPVKKTNFQYYHKNYKLLTQVLIDLETDKPIFIDTNYYTILDNIKGQVSKKENDTPIMLHDKDYTLLALIMPCYMKEAEREFLDIFYSKEEVKA